MRVGDCTVAGTHMLLSKVGGIPVAVFGFVLFVGAMPSLFGVLQLLFMGWVGLVTKNRAYLVTFEL